MISFATDSRWMASRRHGRPVRAISYDLFLSTDGAVCIISCSGAQGVQIRAAMAQRGLVMHATLRCFCRRCHIRPCALFSRPMASDRGRDASAGSSRRSILRAALAPNAMPVPHPHSPAEAQAVAAPSSLKRVGGSRMTTDQRASRGRTACRAHP